MSLESGEYEVSDSSVDTADSSDEEAQAVHREKGDVFTSTLGQEQRSIDGEAVVNSVQPVSLSARSRGHSFGTAATGSGKGLVRTQRFESFDAPSPYMSDDEEFN